jgi:hypothetical protein
VVAKISLPYPEYLSKLPLSIVLERKKNRRASEGSTYLRFSIPIEPADRLSFPDLLGRYPGSAFRFRGRSSLDVAIESATIKQRLEKLRNKHPRLFSGDPLRRVPRADREGYLSAIREIGEYWFDGLFRKLRVTDSISDELRGPAKEFLLAKLRVPEQEIEIELEPHSHEIIPWGMIFDDKLMTTGEWTEKFWGFQHVIHERTAWTGVFDQLPICPKVFVSVDAADDVRQMHQHRFHPLSANTGLCTISSIASESQFYTCMANFPGDCLYHFGKAEIAQGLGATDQALLIGGQRATVARLIQDDAPRYSQGSVLAFLNGCDTNGGDVHSREALLGRLGSYDANKLHCIVSVGKIPSGFAARFGLAFWHSFLRNGTTAGQSLLQARARLNRKGNPLGLLYAFYGLSSLHVR